MLTSVLFASLLFFAGIGSRFKPVSIRRRMGAVAVVLFLLGLTIEFSLPQNDGLQRWLPAAPAEWHAEHQGSGPQAVAARVETATR